MCKSMTRRERLERCYRYKEVDRPAVYSRDGFPGNDPSYDALKAYLKAHTETKAIWHGGGVPMPPLKETRTELYSEDFERHIGVIATPMGGLERTHLVSLKGQPGLHETFFIDSPEAAEKWLSLPMPDPACDARAFFEADAQVGDAGIAEAGLSFNPAGFVAELCGSETFSMMSVTDRDVLHALCQWRCDAMLARVRNLIEQGVGPFFSMLGQEYLVPPLHGKADFDDFNTRYDKPIIDLIHDAGGRIHIHSHGAVKSVFQGFLDMGADVLHPIEPPPQGDILAAEAKALARGRLCLEGNIQIHRMYDESPETIRAETEALIADAFDDHAGLIVSTSASPYIRGLGQQCFPQYKAMIDAVLAYGE